MKKSKDFEKFVINEKNATSMLITVTGIMRGTYGMKTLTSFKKIGWNDLYDPNYVILSIYVLFWFLYSIHSSYIFFMFL